MIKLKSQDEMWQYFQFRPNHDRRRIFGTFQLRECADKYEIWSLSVHKDHRKKGYGTQMLTEFLQQFNHNKPISLYVYKTNEIALRLYKKVGFTIIGDYYGGCAYEMQYIIC